MIPDALCGCCFFQARASIVRKRALPIRRNSPPSKEKEMDASAPALQCYCRIDKKARFRNAFIVNVNVV
jgi:hypothetical protein